MAKEKTPQETTLEENRTKALKAELERLQKMATILEEKLEEKLAKALKDNPDIRVAEAKVREAEAELYRTRLQVTQKVVKASSDILGAKYLIKETQQHLDMVKDLFKRKAISFEEYRKHEQTLQQYKSDQARAEAELNYLLGRQDSSGKSIDVEAFIGPRAVKPSPNVPLEGKEHRQSRGFLDEKTRKALDIVVIYDKRDTKVDDVIKFLQNTLHKEGINLLIRAELENKSRSFHLDVGVRLGAALQLFEDNFGGRFIIREYGIVLVNSENLPPDAMPVLDLWLDKKLPSPGMGNYPPGVGPGRMPGMPVYPGLLPVTPMIPSTTPPGSAPKTKNKSEPPKGKAQRVIERVDPTDNTLVEVTLGTDEGWNWNQVLEVFRWLPEAVDQVLTCRPLSER